MTQVKQIEPGRSSIDLCLAEQRGSIDKSAERSETARQRERERERERERMDRGPGGFGPTFRQIVVCAYVTASVSAHCRPCQFADRPSFVGLG